MRISLDGDALKARLKGIYPEIKRNSKPRQRTRQQACILSDIDKIIIASPESNPRKAEEASLWLFSINTGARAVSATSVLLGDLTWHGTFLVINLRVTKGDQNWNHHVSLVEDNLISTNLNFFYWLR